MAAEGVAFGDARVVEIEVGDVRHADFFHDAARTNVRGNGDGDEFLEVQRAESVLDDCPRAFGGKPFAPMRASKAPADFYGRLSDAGNGEVHGIEADEADKFSGGAEFGGEQAETLLLDLRLGPAGGCVAFIFGERAGEKFADGGIGVQRGEGREVVVFPLTEDEASGGDHDGEVYMAHRQP